MKAQLTQMFSMQDKLNAAINPQWITDDSQDWFCAVLVEGSEMIDHYGWKWWKHQTPDIAQVQLELVDIWHFLMSAEIKSHVGVSTEKAIELSVAKWNNELEQAAEKQPFLALAKQLVGQSAGGDMPYRSFCLLMTSVDFSFADLYKWYIGKNVLNYFRQDHGYKDGSYIKVWQGREDNEYLADALNALPCDEQLSDKVYQFLKAAYPQ
ncbi:MAG: dUTP diphosphatase [Gammaproteobacteria bacterium]|nr:dUTP diphosphatase [Gammaproteobacteria bacterium]